MYRKAPDDIIIVAENVVPTRNLKTEKFSKKYSDTKTKRPINDVHSAIKIIILVELRGNRSEP